MKLQQEFSAELNTITAYGDADGACYVEVNKVRHNASLILFPEGPVTLWPVRQFSALQADDFALLAAQAPELVLFGTGKRLRFAHPKLYAALSSQQIGVETMDLAAACRTFNILAAEGRRVAAALLIESD